MINLLFLMSALVTCAICTFLIISCHYQDGILRRIALGMMAFADLIVVIDGLGHGADYSEILPTTITLQVGVALFMIDHCYSFLMRLRKKGSDWIPARK